MNHQRAQDHRLQRLDDSRLILPNRYDIPVRVFANNEIPMEREAVDQLLDVLAVQETVEAIHNAAPDFFGSTEARVEAVSISPDFHRGSSIPIGTTIATSGFAVPQAIGNDVNCGMRLLTTGLTRERMMPHLDALEQRLRHIFFEGGRNIALTPQQRTALLSEGLPGLLNADAFRGSERDAVEQDLERTHGRGGYAAPLIAALNDYARGSGGASYDSLLGSLGGGNHFAEVQVVQRVLDRAAAHAWGIYEGQVVIMVHSGSLGLGHVANKSVLDAMKAIYPANLPRPKNGIYVLPEGEQYAAVFDHFRAAMRNAANFAFGNRFYLARMVAQALEEVVGTVDAQMIYDAPHNLLWEDEGADGRFLHRKGATPARGWEAMAGTAYAYWGEPVIVPGSMGTASYLLRGSGNDDALRTACHGAGRALSRGAAMRVDDAQLDAFLRTFRVVTPVDIRRSDVRGRRDILKKWREALKQEAGWAYKLVAPVIETLRGADVAQPVAEFFPLMTVKG
jgi:tRNA-splicing ligase RtcB (3'-phosphate/5'-hydroxy nucleic acid ligase)